MTKSTLPEKRNPKIWKPLHRLYQQQLFISALPELLQKKILSNSIFVLNISTQFFCRKANHQAYIEIGHNKYGFACPNCIADKSIIPNTLNLNKLKSLIKYLRDHHSLQVVTFVGHGEPLEKTGARDQTIELIKYVNGLKLTPMVYTGGHSLDTQLIEDLKKNNVSILLSLYGLPFLHPSIFSSSPSLEKYSNALHDLYGKKLFNSQYNLAKQVYELFTLKQTTEFTTNLAISSVGTPGHFEDAAQHNLLKTVTDAAKDNGFAVYVWEEYTKGMSPTFRQELEKKSREFSGWHELGSLYVWNHCQFGTSGAITVLANGDFTHCPHTTNSIGINLDQLVDSDNTINLTYITELVNHAHSSDNLSCIIRNTKLGERLPATVPIQNIIDSESIDSFIKTQLQKNMSLFNLCRENKINLENLKTNLLKTYAWDLSLSRYTNNTYTLSPTLRYLYDNNNQWSTINKKIHHAHKVESKLLQTKIASKKELFNNTIVFFGASEKELKFIETLNDKEKVYIIIDIEPKNIALKVHSLKKQGWNISILDCMFENAYQALKNTNKVKITNSATFCCFGFTIGNYNQYKIWRIFNSIASLYKSTNVLFSLQLTEKASYLKENLNFYNNKIFLDFISKPFETITQIKLKEPQIEFQNNIDGYFSGFIYKYNITTPINIRLENEKSFLLNQSKTVEIYRSIKPTLDEYNHFLATINNKMEVIHNQNEVSILKVLL